MWNGDNYVYLTHEEIEGMEMTYPRHLISR